MKKWCYLQGSDLDHGLWGTLKNADHVLGVQINKLKNSEWLSVYLEGTLKNAVPVLGEQINKLRNTERSWSMIELFEVHNTALWCTSRKSALGVHFLHLKNKKSAFGVQFCNSKTEVHCSSSSPRTLVNEGTVYRVLQLGPNPGYVYNFRPLPGENP